MNFIQSNLLEVQVCKKRKIVIYIVSKRSCKFDDFKILVIKQQKELDNRIDQIPVFGCKSSKYNLKLIKSVFISKMTKKQKTAKKPCKFRYLGNQNSILLVLSFRNWVKTMEHEMNVFFLNE